LLGNLISAAAAAAYLLNYVSLALNLGTNNLQFIDVTVVVATRPTGRMSGGFAKARMRENTGVLLFAAD
jgi:hypothetical protein